MSYNPELQLTMGETKVWTWNILNEKHKENLEIESWDA